jgi:hypothetical protein
VIIQFHTFLTSWLQLSSYLGDNCCSRQEMDLQAQGMMD